MQDSMARTKKTKRIENSDGSSFRVPISETSDQPPDTAGTQGGPSAESSEEGAKVVPSHFTVDLASRQVTPEEQEGSAPSGNGEELDSSDSESSSSSSSRLSISSEERHSRLHEARDSHAAEKGEAEAMDQITASKKVAAMLRASIMQQKRTASNSPAKETPTAQATANIRTELEAAKKRNNELEVTVKSLRDELRPLKEKMTQYDTLEKSLASVKERLFR
ncbi:suppressor protein SRP40-like [Chenopodium quinoa]|uniref:suppressor protein SRP40-like n=1 Tax=Chenopodium quinoa TaxID=63459 RepID=UPI000B796C0F|nr:suppressor protein SRP40-like [Chenopodium quinoa]